MATRFVCLGNSYKEGGRCLAGIKVDVNNNPILEFGKPQWIRPTLNTPHGELPNHLALPYHLLDILEINDTRPSPHHYQSENVYFNEKSIHQVGTFEKNRLNSLCEDRKYIFKTRYPSLSEEVIQELTYSLMLVKPRQFEVIEKVYEDRPTPQQRMVFSYNGFTYDFSITDPVFLHQYQMNHDCVEDIQDVLLSLSVSVKFPPTNRYYKLVAGVIIMAYK
ncbi:MAG TPA: hypothetical protein VGK10_12380 [Prolixibacteraceae bacterium]|jgi:hypothetical protein